MAKVKKKLDPKAKEKCKVTTGVFRASYPHLFKAQKMEGSQQDPKFSLTMLVPKDSDMSIYTKAIRQAKINEFGKDESEWPEDLASPIKNGDSKKNKDKEGYAGHWVIKATSSADKKPGVVDKTGTKILTEASDFYPGCYGRAKLYARVWEWNGTMGLQFLLDHVQFVRDGEAFGGRENALEAFAPIDDEDESEESDDAESDDEDESEDFT